MRAGVGAVGRRPRPPQNDRVPLPSIPAVLRRAVIAATGAVVALTLAACGSVAAQPQAIRPTSAAQVQRAEASYTGSRVLRDDASDTITVAPRRSNGALVVFVHGWGQDRWSLLARRPESGVVHALAGSGFTVLAADGGLKAWGDPASVADYRRLIESTQQRYGLRDVFLMGESMGGLATMQLARALPQVRAVTAWYPVCDLSTMHERRFQESIREAWRGRSRAVVSPVAASDKPLLVWASPDDTVVHAATNAAVCVDEARRAGASVTYFHTSGEHGDPSNFSPEAVVDFFRQHRSPGA